MEGLKSCPFCDSKWQHKEFSTEGVSHIRHVCTVLCVFCGAQIAREANTPEEAEERATEAWNTRA